MTWSGSTRRRLRAIEISPDALRSQRVADIQPAEVDFVRVEALGRVFELARTPSGWTSSSRRRARRIRRPSRR